jgi:hypothetical protein
MYSIKRESAAKLLENIYNMKISKYNEISIINNNIFSIMKNMYRKWQKSKKPRERNAGLSYVRGS